MDDRAYSSIGRQGLASSHCSLDGVPFKISQNFRPPRVISPPQLNLSAASHLGEEYTFETEVAVLAWARARKDAAQKAAAEQAQRQAEAERAQQLKEAETQAALQEQSANAAEPSAIASSEESVYDVPKNGRPVPPARPPPPKKPPALKPAADPGSILKPTPIQKAPVPAERKKSSTSSPGSKFDVSMFEQESDPFDNLELQTLNDMEELKVVLDTTANTALVNHNNMNDDLQRSEEKGTAEVDSESLYELAGPIEADICTNSASMCDVAKPQELEKTQETVKENGESCVTDLKIISQDRGDIGHNGLPNGNGFKTLSDHQKEDSHSTVGQQLNPVMNKKIYKQVLPPISSPQPPPSTNPESKESSEKFSNPFLPHSVNSSNPFLQELSSHPLHANNKVPSETEIQTNQNFRMPVVPDNSNPLKSPPPIPDKPIPKKKPSNPNIRMCTSIGPLQADIFNGDSADSDFDKPKVNCYSRHNNDSPDLSFAHSSPDLTKICSVGQMDSSASAQQWNRYRPLPPTPSPTPPTMEGAKPVLPAKQANQPVGLTDPYNSLSREQQLFTERITSMGFLRAQVARAVMKFGQDEKEVLDHLISVDKLVEKKYAPVHAEAALEKCRNDVDKAERFLKMQSQFEELGFKSESVQLALWKTDLNHDKALDILTA